jgi:hypothetical protein
LFSARSKLLVGIACSFLANAFCLGLRAQDDADTRDKNTVPRFRIAAGAPRKAPQRIATIHWQRVPLRDALGRLHTLFNDPVFVDRRVDPGLRISLDIEAGSAEEVVAAIAAAGRDLGVTRLGRLVYLGPSGAADQVRAISASRSQEVGRVPADLRASLAQKQPSNWSRLGEPRGVITGIVERRGWRLANSNAIPHDLWSAGELPEMTLAEQLTVLLIGFDLTFEVRPDERSIAVVPLTGTSKPVGVGATARRSAVPLNSTHPVKDGKHVYTLRVKEQPVGAVIRELSKRLHWAIQIDEESIRTSGKSLDTRVSFSVENADQEHLLEALLRPAGLDYQLQGEQVRIIVGRYEEK